MRRLTTIWFETRYGGFFSSDPKNCLYYRTYPDVLPLQIGDTVELAEDHMSLNITRRFLDGNGGLNYELTAVIIDPNEVEEVRIRSFDYSHSVWRTKEDEEWPHEEWLKAGWKVYNPNEGVNEG